MAYSPCGRRIAAASDILGADPAPLALKDTRYDLAGQVSEELTYDVSDSSGDTFTAVRYSYDGRGLVVERYVYDPYGGTLVTDPNGAEWLPMPEPWPSASPGNPSRYGNPFMWTGQRCNHEVGLYHFYARSYSPVLGRWLHRDPLGYIDGANLYEYVGSTAIDAIDPLGFLDPKGKKFLYTPDDYKKAVAQVLAALLAEVGKHMSAGDLGALADAIVREMGIGEAIGLRDAGKVLGDPKATKGHKDEARAKINKIRDTIKKRLRKKAKNDKQLKDLLDKFEKAKKKKKEEKEKELFAPIYDVPIDPC